MTVYYINVPPRLLHMVTATFSTFDQHTVPDVFAMVKKYRIFCSPALCHVSDMPEVIPGCFRSYSCMSFDWLFSCLDQFFLCLLNRPFLCLYDRMFLCLFHKLHLCFYSIRSSRALFDRLFLGLLQMLLFVFLCVGSKAVLQKKNRARTFVSTCPDVCNGGHVSVPRP